jgi:hypothetical protein
MSMAEALAKYFRVETNSTILPYIVRDHAWNYDMHDMSGSFFRYRDNAPSGYSEWMDYECPHPTNYPIGNVNCGEEHDPIASEDAEEVCETDDEECEAEAYDDDYDYSDSDSSSSDDEDESESEDEFEDDGAEDDEAGLHQKKTHSRFVKAAKPVEQKKPAHAKEQTH